MPEQGDIVLLPFPFTDLSTIKRRPAIVVSPDSVNRLSQDRIVAAVTSNVMAAPAGGAIPLTNSDLSKGRLPKPSVALPARIFTIHASLVAGIVGRLRVEALRRLLARLRELFREP